LERFTARPLRLQAARPMGNPNRQRQKRRAEDEQPKAKGERVSE
jgi:hypothetical protein